MPPSPSLWETVSPSPPPYPFPFPFPPVPSPPTKLTRPPGCTPKALTHRIAKLKSVANGTGSLDNTPAATPSKRGRPKKPLAPAAENGTGTGDAVDDDEEFSPAKKRGGKRASDPADGATPVKKARGQRAGTGKKATEVKKEEKEEKEEKGEVEMGESDGDALEGVEEGMEGMEGTEGMEAVEEGMKGLEGTEGTEAVEDLPMGQVVKVENGVITLAAAGEED